MDLISVVIVLVFAFSFVGGVVLVANAEGVKACQALMSTKADRDKK